MDKEIKIAFKIEGLDGYITNLEDLKGALGQVETATDQANAATKELSNTVERDFSKLESRLETAEGAVKVLAGSFEALAGAASLLGVEDNEFFKELEDNVIGVIALAEGAINVSEGLKLLAQNQKLATIAQRVFNTVAKANPYVLLASAIIALVGAIAAYVTFVQDDAIPTEEELAAMRERNQKAVEDAKKAEELAEKAEQDRISTLQDLRDELDSVATAEERKNKTTLDGAIATNEALKAEQEEALAATAAFIDAQELRTGQSRKSLEALLEQGLNLSDQEQQLYDLYLRRDTQEAKLNETTNLLNEAYRTRNRILAEQNAVETDMPERLDAITNAFDRQRESIDEVNEAVKNLIAEHNNLKIAQQITYEEGEDGVDGWLVSYQKAFDQFREEPEVWRDKLVSDYQAGFDFVQNLNTLLTKDSQKRAEKAFKLQKALSLAEAVTNTASGITKALTDPTIPSTIGRIAQTVAVAAAGAAQIATISRQKFNPENPDGSTNTQITTPNPAAAITYNFGQQAGEALQLGEAANINTQPVQAYVLASDVTSAQQAQQQIQNLSRL
jgi:myosin heavy subunit